LFLEKIDAMRGHRTGHIEQHGNSKPWNTSCNWFVVRGLLNYFGCLKRNEDLTFAYD